MSIFIHSLTNSHAHSSYHAHLRNARTHRAEDVEGEEYKQLVVKDIDTNRPVILKFFDTERAEELLEKAHVVICVADITDSDGCDTYLRSYWHVKSQNRGTIRHAYFTCRPNTYI